MKKTWISTLSAAALMFASSVFAETAVIVHPSNNNAVDLQLVKRIYLGKVKSFKSGAKVVAFDQPNGSNSKKGFLSTVVGKSGSQYKAYWSKLLFTGKGKPPKELDSDKAVIDAVAANEAGIGYVDAGSVSDNVKVVAKF